MNQERERLTTQQKEKSEEKFELELAFFLVDIRERAREFDARVVEVRNVYQEFCEEGDSGGNRELGKVRKFTWEFMQVEFGAGDDGETEDTELGQSLVSLLGKKRKR